MPGRRSSRPDRSQTPAHVAVLQYSHVQLDGSDKTHIFNNIALEILAAGYNIVRCSMSVQDHVALQGECVLQSFLGVSSLDSGRANWRGLFFWHTQFREYRPALNRLPGAVEAAASGPSERFARLAKPEKDVELATEATVLGIKMPLWRNTRFRVGIATFPTRRLSGGRILQTMIGRAVQRFPIRRQQGVGGKIGRAGTANANPEHGEKPRCSGPEDLPADKDARQSTGHGGNRQLVLTVGRGTG